MQVVEQHADLVYNVTLKMRGKEASCETYR